jgi:hypothetical protein
MFSPLIAVSYGNSVRGSRKDVRIFTILYIEYKSIRSNFIFCNTEMRNCHASIFYRLTVHFDIYRVHLPTNALLLTQKSFKIYIKIHTEFSPTCFGLRPSAGSLHWSLTEVIFMI